MKLRITVLITLLSTIGIILTDGYFNSASTHINGAPNNCCGSVGHTNTCTACHSGGSNAIRAGWITSTIPASGYVPGTTYTINAMATYAGRSRFGFEIASENYSGAHKGTFIITNTTRTKSISAGTFVTHTLAGVTDTIIPHSDTCTWIFNWTAPAAGTGTVTFYGAFLCSNSNNSESGDLTFKANLPATEDVTTGITNNISFSPAVSVYPNPVSEELNINYRIDHQGMVEIKLFDAQGQMTTSFLSELKAPGDYQNSFKIPFNLNSGIYFLEIATETGNTVKRILVQQ